jgi:hypothetical protein
MENDRSLDSLLDEYFLETKPELWHPRPVLSQNQWAVFNGLVSRLEDDDHVVLAGCALSAFFDPTRHEAGHTHDVKKMSSLFAIAHGRNKINTKPLLFVTDEESDASGATEFLELWGAPMLRFEPLVSPQDFVEKAVSRLGKVRSYSGDRRPINPVEHKVAFQIGATTPHNCLHEVAVNRMIPEYALSYNTELVESIRRLGPVDIVIHSQDSNRPLLCVEVDGQTHTTARRQLQDNRKTTLLREIGLPVLRILPSDIRLWQNIWSKEFQLYSRVLCRWASRISEGVNEWRTEDIEEHHFEQEVVRLREQLSRAIFDTEYRSLAPEQQLRIDRSNLIADLREDKYYSDLVRAGPPSLVQPNELSNLTDPPPRLARHIGRVRIRGSAVTGVVAESTLRLKGISENLQSATFFLSHPYLTEVESDKQLTNLALRHLYLQADQKVAEHRR